MHVHGMLVNPYGMGRLGALAGRCVPANVQPGAPGANVTNPGTQPGAPAGVTNPGTPPPAVSNITLPAANLPNGVAGQPYSAQISASGFLGSITGWAMPQGSYPPGVVGPSGGTYQQTLSLQGTPSSAGTFTFTLQATDSSGAKSAPQTYTIVVQCPPGYVDSGLSGFGGLRGCRGVGAATLPALTLPPGIAGQPYSAQIAATGFVGSITQWLMPSGAYPPGIVGPSGGQFQEIINLQGTPTSAGTFTFTLQCQDASGAKSQPVTYTIVIQCPVGYVDSGLSGLRGLGGTCVVAPAQNTTGGANTGGSTNTGGSSSSGSTASSDNWLTDETIFSGFPNWAVLAGGLAAVMVLPSLLHRR